MRSFLLISILFVLGTKFPGMNCQENGFYNFLFNAAEAFPSWIAQNGLDPTPEIPDELSLEYSEGFVNITAGKIWKQVMSGHSARLPDPYLIGVSENLLLGNFRVRLPYYGSNFTVTSEYEVEGTVLSSIPITGAGTVTSKLGYLKYVELNVYGFELTPDGYIDISAGSVDARFDFTLDVASFEGLSAGGYEAEVERILKDVYGSKLRRDSFPMAEYLRSYMEELFEKTPLSEIIDTTMPPAPTPTPTEDPPTATTERSTPGISSTSEAPCRSSMFGADGSTLLEEKVLKKSVTVKESGKKVEIIEKLVKLERELKD